MSSTEEESDSLVGDSTRNLLTSKSDENGAEYEEAILAAGYGKFHYKLLALCGWALSSDAIEVLCISFVLPSATCDFRMTGFYKGLLTAIIFLGMLFGGYIWGSFADTNGRRSTLLVSLLINSLGGGASSLCQNYTLFLIFRLISGIGVGGALPIIFTYFCEFQPKNKRGVMISLLATCWMSGNIIAAALAWTIIPLNIRASTSVFTFNSWRVYLLLCTLPSFTSFLLFLRMPESPKFVMKSGDGVKALSIFQDIFKANNYSPTHIDYPIKSLNFKETQPVSNCRQAVYSIFLRTKTLWQKNLRRKSLILTIVYATFSFGYYGLWMWFPEIFNKMEKYGGTVCSVKSGNQSADNETDKFCDDINPNIYWEGLIVASSNLPGNIFTIFFIEKLGRRWLLSSSMVVSGVSAFAILGMKTKLHNILLSSVFSCISVIGWNALDVLNPELFPTELRSSASGFFSAIGRIATVTANLTFGLLVDIHCAVPLILVSALLVSGGFSALLLPETRNIDLS